MVVPRTHYKMVTRVLTILILLLTQITKVSTSVTTVSMCNILSVVVCNTVKKGFEFLTPIALIDCQMILSLSVQELKLSGIPVSSRNLRKF